MPTIKNKQKSIKTSRKKCQNGFRIDKESGICIKYTGFKLFDKLENSHIDENGHTISIESLAVSTQSTKDDKIMFKLYNHGKIYHQEIINDKKIEKAKKITQLNMKNIFRAIRKCKKNPNHIMNDKGFQKFKKKYEKKMGGANPTTKPKGLIKSKVVVDKKVSDSITDPKIAKLQKNITTIQQKTPDTNDISIDWWSQMTIFNLLSLLAEEFKQGISLAVTSAANNADTILKSDVAKATWDAKEAAEKVLTPTTNLWGQSNAQQLINTADKATAYKMAITAKSQGALAVYTADNAATATLTPLFEFDMGAALFIILLDIVTAVYPNDDIEEIKRISQYIYWIWLIGSTVFFLIPLNWWWSFSLVMPMYGIYNSVIHDKSVSVIDAKQKLATAIEEKVESSQ
jgi:hypothetical protein